MMRRDRIGLALLALLFLAWHVPLAYRTEAGLDEDWYGVPGITILRTGLPQIPYIPSRDPGSACFKADVILDALPPSHSTSRPWSTSCSAPGSVRRG